MMETMVSNLVSYHDHHDDDFATKTDGRDHHRVRDADGGSVPNPNGLVHHHVLVAGESAANVQSSACANEASVHGSFRGRTTAVPELVHGPCIHDRIYYLLGRWIREAYDDPP